jgi:ABC-type transporter Mla maintaining outer membrane lipid asymmetry permease subunit MlaE
MTFLLGLSCGINGAYFARAVGAPQVGGSFSALCDLREIMPYAFGYMMSAKVGTGLVAEIGAMRISDEIDALEVMGIDSLGGLYYGYTASGGPVGVGTATAKSMVFNTVAVHVISMLGTMTFWGVNPRAPVGG